mmetsp:Transcript_18404/g.55439  ORF Transcript_18404/g.55439 Transcript_18404/m.55439 type:complete len:239 (+) Transcript_18404:8660-9376(+)
MVMVPARHTGPPSTSRRRRVLSRRRPSGSSSWQGVPLSRARQASMSSAGTDRVAFTTMLYVSSTLKVGPAVMGTRAGGMVSGRVGNSCFTVGAAGEAAGLAGARRGGRPAASRSAATRRLNSSLLSATKGFGALRSRVSLPTAASGRGPLAAAELGVWEPRGLVATDAAASPVAASTAACRFLKAALSSATNATGARRSRGRCSPMSAAGARSLAAGPPLPVGLRTAGDCGAGVGERR